MLNLVRRITEYINTLPITVRVKCVDYFSDNGFLRNEELELCSRLLSECPDMALLIFAIEKKISRTPLGIKSVYTVPMCMLLIMSSEYSVAYFKFVFIPDNMIKKCWQCLEAILMTVKPELQCWLNGVKDKRSYLGFTTVHRKSRQDQPYPEGLPHNLMSRGIRMVPVDLLALAGTDRIWDPEDFIAYSAIAYETVLSDGIREL